MSRAEAIRSLIRRYGWLLWKGEIGELTVEDVAAEAPEVCPECGNPLSQIAGEFLPNKAHSILSCGEHLWKAEYGFSTLSKLEEKLFKIST